MTRTLYDGYSRYVLSMWPILKAASVRGVSISPERYEAVSMDLTRQLSDAHATMQRLVPAEIRPFHPKTGYVRGIPTDKEGHALPGNFQLRSFRAADVDEIEFVERWVKLDDWAPSHQGLIRYMQHRGHLVPKHFKTGEDTTVEKDLRRLAHKTKDPLYEAVLLYRSIQTILKNHIKNWAPGPDSKVHPVFYFAPATGQLSARRPNTMNAPKHGETQEKRDIAKAFRSIVSASPGHVLLEFDYKAFHVQTLAFEAQDIALMRAAKADVHSFLTAHFLKLPKADRLLELPDKDLLIALSVIKGQHREVRDAKVKHALLGYDNGMGYRKLYFQYQEFFESMGEAKRLMLLLDQVFPKAHEFRQRITRQAHERGYLVSRFGCIRWFWEVYKWRQGGWEHGDDAEAAKSFLQQNDAHCYLKEAVLRLNDAGWLERARFINPVHDALWFDCPLDLVDEAIPSIAEEMERPSDVLVDSVVAPSGLSVEVSVTRGPSLNDMHEVDWHSLRRAT